MSTKNRSPRHRTRSEQGQLYSSRKQLTPPQIRRGMKDVATPTNGNKAGTPINQSLTQIFHWEKFQKRAETHQAQISIPSVWWSTRYEVKNLFTVIGLPARNPYPAVPHVTRRCRSPQNYKYPGRWHCESVISEEIRTPT